MEERRLSDFSADYKTQCRSWKWSKMLSPSEDGQEGPLRFLQSHGKIVQLLLHEETSCLLRQIHSDHGAAREEEEKGEEDGEAGTVSWAPVLNDC